MTIEKHHNSSIVITLEPRYGQGHEYTAYNVPLIEIEEGWITLYNEEGEPTALYTERVWTSFSIFPN